MFVSKCEVRRKQKSGGLRGVWKSRPVWLVVLLAVTGIARPAAAQVRVWRGEVTIPTYPWESDVNPKFWALEGGPRLSTTVRSAIIYPYTMQDHLSRRKVPRTYRAVFLENEYIKITCLPDLGGRLHEVIDKSTGRPMFYSNHVIKPSMIAMRGAWISGGVEWNNGPHGHTVSALEPLDVVTGTNDDGSAFLEIVDRQQIFDTRTTVRVTLRPGRSYLEEQVELYNPTDGVHPYYFWNCTAFPNRPGTRFIYPMTLGMDHSARKFFSWPVHEGKDISWLKNYETWASVFAYRCQFDFFGAYDVDLDQGIVQFANHRVLPGKKAWTWGNWDFGLVSQKNLTDSDGPYIEVQSGPLPTQSDYGLLYPRQAIRWQEWWYPVHGLGDGFEFATGDLAIETTRSGKQLQLRILATGNFPGARCRVRQKKKLLLERQVDLSPRQVAVLSLSDVDTRPVEIAVTSAEGKLLAAYTSPLEIPKETPPSEAELAEKPDDQLSTEEKFFRGQKYDRDSDRIRARRYYQAALEDDPGYTAPLRALAVLDLEAGQYHTAAERLEAALHRNNDDGLAWYWLGVCRLHQGKLPESLDCAYQAVRCPGTPALGYDLAGRVQMRQGKRKQAVTAFRKALAHNAADLETEVHLQLALFATGHKDEARNRARELLARCPTALVPRFLLALGRKKGVEQMVTEARTWLGDYDFAIIGAALRLADLGLYEHAATLLRAACYEGTEREQRNPLALYWLAYWLHCAGNAKAAAGMLDAAAPLRRDFVFASRVEALPVFRFAVTTRPNDAQAHFQLGNLLASLGRIDEATRHWQRATRLDPRNSIAWRNLGLVAAAKKNDLAEAAECYRRAIAARPNDQTLYRDLAEILAAGGKRSEAIRLLETMPRARRRRADVIILQAQYYCDEKRWDDAIELLQSTPYFVNWEGQDITWRLFHRAHMERGIERFDQGKFEAALHHFQAALTYPENLGVGRSNKPEHARALYWQGKALAALGRHAEARRVWQQGAAAPEGSDQQNEYRKKCQEALRGGSPGNK